MDTLELLIPLKTHIHTAICTFWIRILSTNSTFENYSNSPKNTVIHIKRDKSLEIRKLDQVVLTNKMAINNPWSNLKPTEEKEREKKWKQP